MWDERTNLSGRSSRRSGSTSASASSGRPCPQRAPGGGAVLRQADPALRRALARGRRVPRDRPRAAAAPEPLTGRRGPGCYDSGDVQEARARPGPVRADPDREGRPRAFRAAHGAARASRREPAPAAPAVRRRRDRGAVALDRERGNPPAHPRHARRGALPDPRRGAARPGRPARGPRRGARRRARRRRGPRPPAPRAHRERAAKGPDGAGGGGSLPASARRLRSRRKTSPSASAGPGDRRERAAPPEAAGRRARGARVRRAHGRARTRPPRALLGRRPGGSLRRRSSGAASGARRRGRASRR